MLPVLKGLNDSLSLLAYRFTSAKWIYKIIMLTIVAGFFLAVYVATFASESMLVILTTPIVDSPGAESVEAVRNYVATYLSLYASGDLDTFVAISVGVLLGSIVFVPFSGYIIHGVVSNSELTTLKNGDYYRIGDSIIFQFISSFTFIQLVGLTLISELLTIDTPNPGLVTIFVWVAWIALTLLTALLAWAVEYISRRFGTKIKLSFLALIILGFGIIIFLDPNKATTLFGSAPYIFSYLQTIAQGNLWIFAQAIIASLIVVALALVAIGKVASKALELPELPSIKRERKNKKVRNVVHPTKFGFITLLLNLLFRYPTVFRPIFTSVLFSTIIVLVLDGSQSILTTLIVLPLAVGIAFGANMFGLFGNANNWLLSIPKFREHIVKIFAAVLAIMIGGIYVLVYGLAFLAGRLSFDDVITALPSMVSVTFTVVVLSVFFSVKNPLPFSAKTRENIVSSPLVLIGYVAAFVATSSLFGNLPTVIDDTLTVWMVTAGLALISVGLLYIIELRWKHSEVWAQRVLNKTVNAG